MATEENKIIYSMIRVSKSYNQKKILEDIYLLVRHRTESA